MTITNNSDQWKKLFIEYNKYAFGPISFEASLALGSVNIGVGNIIKVIKESIPSGHEQNMLRTIIEDAVNALGSVDNEVDKFIVYAIEISENDLGEIAESNINAIIRDVKFSK